MMKTSIYYAIPVQSQTETHAVLHSVQGQRIRRKKRVSWKRSSPNWSMKTGTPITPVLSLGCWYIQLLRFFIKNLSWWDTDMTWAPSLSSLVSALLRGATTKNIWHSPNPLYQVVQGNVQQCPRQRCIVQSECCSTNKYKCDYVLSSITGGYQIFCKQLFLLCRILQGELKRLKWRHAEAGEQALLGEVSPDSGGSGSGDVQSEELLSEARILRHHKSRLETRMQILEDHNKQLESQLHRLRELLLQVQTGPDWDKK